MIDKPALKEAVTDTILATPVNLFLNYVLLAILLSWGWGAEAISIALTIIFFIFAVIRKYYVRQFFKRKASK